MTEKGLIVVISAPSGTGKGTVIKEVRNRHARFEFSVSATTREIRKGEKQGVDYFFVSRDEFLRMIHNDELVEWVEYCGNFYGTQRKAVEDCCGKGNDIFLDIEVQGALAIKRRYPESVHIFMLPPSFQELERRISKRGTETDEEIRNRIQKAVDEIQYMKEYDYVFINRSIDESVENVLTIIKAEKMRQDRNQDILKSIINEEGDEI